MVSFLQVNLRDAFGNPAKDLGESTIYFYSPHLRYARVPISDTELIFEVSAEKAVATAPVWVQRVIPSGLHATVYSYASGLPKAHFLASTLDLPCYMCFPAEPGQSYIYRFVFRTF